VGKLDLHLGASDVGIRNVHSGLWFLLRCRHEHGGVGGPGSDEPAGERTVGLVPDALDLHEAGHISAEVTGLGERAVDAGLSDLEDVRRLTQGIGGIQGDADDPGGVRDLVKGEWIDRAGLVVGLETGQITIEPDPDQPALARGRHCHVLDRETELSEGAGGLQGALEVAQDVVDSFLDTQLTPPLPFQE